MPPRRELVTNKAEFNPNFMSEKIYFGVDVCKESLAFCGAGVAGQVANNAPGVRRLLARLPKGAHLIIEASGGYERELVRVAQQSAVQLSVVNPRQVRDFARGVGRLAKTDPIDAEMLARFGAEVNPPPDAVPTAAEVVLQELVSARQQLVEERTVLLQQKAQHLNSIVRRLDCARLKLLQRQIAQLELAIGSILEEQICAEAKSRAPATSQRRRVDHRCHLRRSVSRARLTLQRPNSGTGRRGPLQR